MSRRELAEAANAYVWQHPGGRQRTNMTEHDIGRYERGEVHWPRSPWRRYGLRGVLGASGDTELGFFDRRTTTDDDQLPEQPHLDTERATSTDTTTPLGPPPVVVAGVSSIVPRDEFSVLEGAGDEVNRREVLTAGGVIVACSMIPVPERARRSDGIAEVASALVGTRSPGQALSWSTEPVGEDVLSATVTALKARYQAGRYREVVKALPPLLRTIGDPDPSALHGERLLVLAANVYQTACSVLLKLGDHALAMLAADRSMAAARRSGDPVTAAASARALAHALASDGQHELAAAVALSAARKVSTDQSATVAERAVYGALLLRASVIAAGEDRTLALDALSEANETAQRIGNDHNAVWTYFCPTNVQLHKVSVAVNLGDAGQAIDHARHVDLNQIPLAERRACFWTDVARAYLQWGKYERALKAVRAAERAAPEEVAVRPQVHRVVEELQRCSTPSVQGQAAQLARRIGVAR
jgi:tetratricopeptide (TPR) repeat protein